MARDEARVFVTIWNDDDFLELSPSAQRLYLYLLSQKDLSYCGLIALRPGRWARSAKNLTPADVLADLRALAAVKPRPFVILDEETEEVLVRSFIRNDRIWKQPNIMKAAQKAATLIESPTIRAALIEELKRIPIEETDSRLARKALAEFLQDMGELPDFPADIPSANPSGKGSANPSSHPSPNPSGNPSEKGSQGKGERGRGSSSSPSVDSEGSSFSSEEPDSSEPARLDVERLCTYLAERIETNGSKRPVITKKWRDAARLLMDSDGKSEQQVRNMIDWCQNDHFWRGVILSMPKLREKYDQMRLQASGRTAGPPSANSTAPQLPQRGTYDASRVFGKRTTK